MPEIYSTDDLIDLTKSLEDYWSGWRGRMLEIHKLIEGRFSEVWRTQGEPDTEYPMVGNLFRTTTEDGGRLFAESMPQDRVDPASDKELRQAEKRERILHAYNHHSEVYEQPILERFGQDMIAAGLTGIKVWPEFSKPASKRFPTFRRVDPTTILPEPRWNPTRPTERVVTHYQRPLSDVAREFKEAYVFGDVIENPMAPIVEAYTQYRQSFQSGPVLLGSRAGHQVMQKLKPPEVEVADFWATDIVARVCWWEDDEGRRFSTFLSALPNRTGICPVQLAPRPSWSDEPTGQLDDSKGVARTRNRYFKMLVDYFAQMVYGPTLLYNVKQSPGGIWHALSPDASAQRLGPEQVSFQVFNVLQMLEEEERTGKMALRSREGEVDLNKATAAFLTRAQGQLVSVTRSLNASFATAKRRANEAAFAQDETWCNAKKEITGKLRGRRFRDSYTPKKDIKGDYSNRVVYGTSSGLDPSTHQVLMLQKLGQGVISQETFMENDPGIDEVPIEKRRILRERMEASILSGLEMPDVPLPVRIKFWQMYQQGRDVEDIIQELKRDLMPQEPALPNLAAAAPETPAAAGPPGPPGIPEAEQPVVEALPPLPELEAGAARRR